MKKFLIFVILPVIMLFATVGCNSKTSSKADRQHNSQNSLDWKGSYTNDTTTIFLNDNGVCRIVTAGNSVGGSYVWEVDGGSIAIVDEEGNVFLYKVCEGYLLSATTGSRLDKVNKH